MNKLVRCQCGQTIRGKDDEDLIRNVQQHGKDVHGMAEISREQVLAMAQPDTESN